MTDNTVIPDPFDPDALRLSQDFGAMVGVKKLLSVVPVRKPGRQDFVRTHPDPDYRLTTTVIEVQEDRESYLVAPDLRGELMSECSPVTLFTAVNRQGTLFLWPCKLPGSDGRTNRWHESALDAAERAQSRWMRVQADMSLGAYQVYEPRDPLPIPSGPTTVSGIYWASHFAAASLIRRITRSSSACTACCSRENARSSAGSTDLGRRL